MPGARLTPRLTLRLLQSAAAFCMDAQYALMEQDWPPEVLKLRCGGARMILHLSGQHAAKTSPCTSFHGASLGKLYMCAAQPQLLPRGLACWTKRSGRAQSPCLDDELLSSSSRSSCREVRPHGAPDWSGWSLRGPRVRMGVHWAGEGTVVQVRAPGTLGRWLS